MLPRLLFLVHPLMAFLLPLSLSRTHSHPSVHRMVHFRAGDDDAGVPAVAGIPDQSECNPDVLLRSISGHHDDRGIRFTSSFW